MAGSADSSASVRAAVYLATGEDRALAEQVLGTLDADAGERFNGVFEGELELSQVKRLDEAGLVVTLIDELAATDPSREWDAEDAETIEELRERAQAVSLNPKGDSLVVDKTGGNRPDRRLHRVGGLTPQVSQALPEDAYNIELEAPITEEQRLEFDGLGVDIAALEPGFGYRTMLTKKQYAAVRKLPYVAAVNRYRFSQAVTPELLELVSDDEGGESGLLSADEEATPEPHLFDCLLHREEDGDEVARLIENTPNTEVIDRTNLRIRFEAAADLPLLAALALLPEVRQITPYEPPTL